MKHEIQIEFALEDKSEIQVKIEQIEKRLDDMKKAQDNLRKGLFSRFNELSKLCIQLKEDIEKLERKDKKIEWVYGQKNCLFDVREA